MSDYFICPHCGADVDMKAVICPECGSDDETGWSADTVYDGIYLDGDGVPPTGYSKTAKNIIIVISLLIACAMAGSISLYFVPIILIGSAYAFYQANL